MRGCCSRKRPSRRTNPPSRGNSRPNRGPHASGPHWTHAGGTPAARLARDADRRHVRLMIVLGIETSCDETAVAVVGDQPRPLIRSNLIHSQLAEHAPYGGVVPEIAARAHLDHIARLVRHALAE